MINQIDAPHRILTEGTQPEIGFKQELVQPALIAWEQSPIRPLQ